MFKSPLFEPHNFIHITASLIVIFIVLILWAAFFPASWNWGIHFLSFYSLEIIFLVPLAFILIFIPSVQERLIKKISAFARWYFRQHVVLRVVYSIAGLAALTLIFWLFRVQTYFLGDGQLIARSIKYVESPDEFVLGYKREPLIGFCLLFLTNIFIALKHINPTGDAYCWMSILSGIGFAITGWILVKKYSQDHVEQLLLYALLLSTGVIQLFFGYIENYAPSAVGVLLFLLLGTVYIRGTISIAWPFVVYTIILMFHLGTLSFLPLIAYLAYLAVKRKQLSDLGATLFLSGVIVFVLLQLSLYPFRLLQEIVGETNTHIVPFSPPLNKYQAYTMFSPRHAIDLLNFFILCYPAVLTLFFLSSVRAWKVRVSIPAETRFLLLAALCGLGFIGIVNCDIGMSRDWDILAPISLGIPIATFALWKSIDCEKQIRYRVLLLLCFFSFIHTGLWIGVNADEIKSEKRFNLLLDERFWGKIARLNSYEELAVYHRDRGDNDKAITYYKKYIGLDSTNPRLWGNLAGTCQTAGRIDEAVQVFESMINRGMGSTQIKINIGVMLAENGRYSGALKYFQEVEKEEPTSPLAKYNVGNTFMQGDRNFKKALPYFMEAIKLDSTFFQAYINAAACYQLTGDSAKANQMIDRSRKFYRNNTE